MSTPIIPRPEFLSLTETDVLAALRDPDGNNPIAIEFARLIKGYGENFAATCDRLGHIPESILHVKPRSAIEALAMAQVTEIITDQLSAEAERDGD